MIKIAIAEDNKFLAQALINKIGLVEDFKVKYQACDGEELLDQLSIDSNIDVVLMDIQMPNLDGIATTKVLTKKYPHIKIIMLTIYDNEQNIYDSLQAGAIGYLLKESTHEQIKESIEELLAGGAPMSPEVARKAVNIIRNPSLIQKEQGNYGLSKREKDVLMQLCKGLNYNEIASNLIISPNTVRKHIENIYSKLDVRNKAEAILLAYKHQLV